MSHNFLSVAIDGPAGAGKSTTARRLAQELGIVYVDSGAMYRAVALSCVECGIDFTDTTRVAELASHLKIGFVAAPEPGAVQRLIVEGRDVTGDIRTPLISAGASTVSTIPEVREVLVAKQREMGKHGGVVMEGRDIGTVVLPDAECKIFLTASLDERANRRYTEMLARGESAIIEKVKAEIADRDYRDQNRPVSPLRPADDAIILDSENMSADQVVERMRDLALQALQKST